MHILHAPNSVQYNLLPEQAAELREKRLVRVMNLKTVCDEIQTFHPNPTMRYSVTVGDGFEGRWEDVRCRLYKWGLMTRKEKKVT